jgi:hypothetical protein
VSNIFEGPGAINVSVTEDAQRWLCQVVGMRWVMRGFEFDYCPEPQRFLAIWQTHGRSGSTQLRICDAHARELVARHAPTVVAPPPTEDEDPFGDVDAPYARARGSASRP